MEGATCLSYGLHDCLGLGQHLVIPEPKHAVPLALQPPRPLLIILLLLEVLAAIDLNDEASLMADEVNDVSPQHHLSAELNTMHLATTKSGP